jgi:hypothetical protein
MCGLSLGRRVFSSRSNAGGGFEKGEQIVGRRSQRARTRHRAKVPVRGRFEDRRVARHEAVLHRRRQRDPCAGKAQRIADASDDETFVVPVRPARQNVPEQSETEIGVFVVGARVVGQGVSGQERVEVRDGVGGERIEMLKWRRVVVLRQVSGLARQA